MCDELKTAILSRARIDGDLVIVESFLNHRVEIDLIRAVGGWLADHLPEADAVITSEASGIAPAFAVAEAMAVPMIYAKRRPAPREGMLSRQVESATKGDRPWLEMVPGVVGDLGTAIVVDDFLAGGRTALALGEMLMDAGVDVLAFGFAVERAWAGGRARLEAAGHRVVAAATVVAVENGAPVLA